LIKLWLSALALSGFRFAAIQLSFAAKDQAQIVVGNNILILLETLS
jgi:hypothetical protein